MDIPRLLRSAVWAYFGIVGLLGVGTAGWAALGLLQGRSMVVGQLWLVVAGTGTVLTVALLGRYLRRRLAEPAVDVDGPAR